MRGVLLGVMVLVILLPVGVLAAEHGPDVLSLKSGVPAQLIGKTMAMAKSFLAISIVIALVVEAFGSSALASKDYGGIVARTLVVMVLLSGYSMLFGSIISTCAGIADSIAPQDTFSAFWEHHRRALETLRSAANSSGTGEGFIGPTLSPGTALKGYVGGFLFDSLVLLVVSLGQGLHWAFTHLTRIIIVVLYLLGPLALVWHIPAPSDVARRWFRSFVTVCSWPIFTALLQAVGSALLLKTSSAATFGEYGTAFGALASTLLMVAMCLAVPNLASALIGGSVKNIAGASLFAGGALAMTASRLGNRAWAVAGLGSASFNGALQSAQRSPSEQIGQSVASGFSGSGGAGPVTPSFQAETLQSAQAKASPRAMSSRKVDS